MDKYINVVVTTPKNVYIRLYRMKVSEYFDTFIVTLPVIENLLLYHYYDLPLHSRHHMNKGDIKIVIREFIRKDPKFLNYWEDDYVNDW